MIEFGRIYKHVDNGRRIMAISSDVDGYIHYHYRDDKAAVYMCTSEKWERMIKK